MKKLLRSSAAKIIAYILLVISCITGVTSGLGIYSAIVLRFYNMQYYVPDETLILDTPIACDYENLRIMILTLNMNSSSSVFYLPLSC